MDCERLRHEHGRCADGPWIVFMVCILEMIGRDWGTRFYIWRYVALLGWVCLLACLLATSSSDDGLRDAIVIVKTHDYKPAWIARYEGMIIGLGFLHGVGIGGVKA